MHWNQLATFCRAAVTISTGGETEAATSSDDPRLPCVHPEEKEREEEANAAEREKEQNKKENAEEESTMAETENEELAASARQPVQASLQKLGNGPDM